jgi:hypothetical protein
MFNVSSCIDAANSGRVEDWVHAYLGAGPWANSGLREGLQRHPRHWIGPLLLPLQRLERCCGPETGMEFSVPADAWHCKVSEIASGLTDPKDLPPLIVEWRAALLSIRDGNHRYAAMTAAGWRACWVIIWCNSAGDHARARTALGQACGPVPTPQQW